MRTLLLLLLLCLAAPAQADLQFQGRWPNESQVRAEFARFPPRLQAKLAVTTLRLRIGPSSAGHSGHYDDNPPDHVRTITVGDPRDFKTLDHEGGHFFLEACCPVEERVTWPGFWKHRRRDFPTRYSRTNAEEGFAEAYRTCFDGSHLRRVVRTKLRELGVP